MKTLKRIVIGIVCAAVMMSSAATALADETTAASQPSGTEESTTSTFDISNMSFDTMYGNQVMDFLNHQYEYEGQKIPITESNYYFLLTFLQLSQYAAYGYYPATSAGYIDLAAQYGDNGKTYAEYYVDQAEQYLQSTYILIARAKAAGIKLEAKDKEAIEQEIKDRIDQQAIPAGVPLDTILKLYFGPDCDEKAYRAILENATLAGKYQEKYASEYKIPEDQKMVPNIRYALFYAPGASATDDDKKKAENAANEMLKKCKNLDDLKKYAEAGQQDGSVYDQGTLPVRKGEMVSTFEEWAYGAGRKEGEMGIIYAKEYGYFCVGYVGKVKLEDEEISEIASEALNAEIEKEMKENKHGFKTDQKYSAAKPAPTAPAETSADGTEAGTETAPTALPTDNGTNPENGMSNVLIIVFVAIGGVAILAVIIILVMNYTRSGKEDDDAKKPSSAKKDTKKPASKKPSRPVIEDEEEDEEEEDDDDELPEEQEDPYSGLSGDEEPEEKTSGDGVKDKSKNNKKNGKRK